MLKFSVSVIDFSLYVLTFFAVGMFFGAILNGKNCPACPPPEVCKPCNIADVDYSQINAWCKLQYQIEPQKPIIRTEYIETPCDPCDCSVELEGCNRAWEEMYRAPEEEKAPSGIDYNHYNTPRR